MFTFGTGTSTDQAVTTVAKTYSVGASGIWYQWLWIFATPVYWLLAPLFRRMRAVTTADYLHARYGQSVAVLFAVVGILSLSVQIGVMLKACGAMVTSVTAGAVSEDLAIYGMTVLFVIYGVAGGLSAAVITDFIQGILTVVLSFLILPFALQAVGIGLAFELPSVVDGLELVWIVQAMMGVSMWFSFFWRRAPGHGRGRLGFDPCRIRDLVPDQHHSGCRRHDLGLQRPVRAPAAGEHDHRRRAVPALADADLPVCRGGRDGGRQPPHQAPGGGTARQDPCHPAHAGVIGRARGSAAHASGRSGARAAGSADRSARPRGHEAFGFGHRRLSRLFGPGGGSDMVLRLDSRLIA